jgi:hypothetical protein
MFYLISDTVSRKADLHGATAGIQHNCCHIVHLGSSKFAILSSQSANNKEVSRSKDEWQLNDKSPRCLRV